jgi:hypothetical protein
MTRFTSLLLLPAVALAAPVPKELKDEARLLVTAAGAVTLMTPDGGNPTVIHAGGADEYVYRAWLSPDRTRFAYFYKERPDARVGKTLLGLREVGGKQQAWSVSVPCPDGLFWSADGKTLFGTTQKEKGGQGNVLGYRSWRIDAANGERTRLELPADCVLVAPLRGSTKVACLRYARPAADKSGAGVPADAELLATDPDTFAPTTVLGAARLTPVAVFPDGKRWLRHASGEVAIHTVGEQEAKAWPREPFVSAVALAPSGKRVAYTTFDWNEKAKTTRWQVWTADPDGTNAVKVLARDDEERISHIDWR